MRYIRFVLMHEGKETGLIQARSVYYDFLPEEEKVLLQRRFDYLNANLETPHLSEESNYVCWFKGTATLFIDSLLQMMNILVRNGYEVKILKSDDNLDIFYEDEYQVVAREKKHE